MMTQKFIVSYIRHADTILMKTRHNEEDSLEFEMEEGKNISFDPTFASPLY